MATRFGADRCWNVAQTDADETAETILATTGGHGVDVAFEVCGVRQAVGQGVRALRIGGRYLIAGLVSPGSDLGLDGNQLTRKCLTVKGIHNYRPEHLGRALRFLDEHAQDFPYDELVGTTFGLDQIDRAVEVAASAKFIRVGIRPNTALTKSSDERANTTTRFRSAGIPPRPVADAAGHDVLLPVLLHRPADLGLGHKGH